MYCAYLRFTDGRGTGTGTGPVYLNSTHQLELGLELELTKEYCIYEVGLGGYLLCRINQYNP
jgi:hypothetical protein